MIFDYEILYERDEGAPPVVFDMIGFSSVVLERLAKQITVPNPKVLEIGSWCGASARTIGKAIKPMGGTLYCVDWWRGSDSEVELTAQAKGADIFAIFQQVIAESELEDVVKIMKMRSDDAFAVLAESFDMIFIDGDHSYSQVYADICNSLDKLKPGGILCGHDCEMKFADARPYHQTEILKTKEKGWMPLECKDMEGLHSGVIAALHHIFRYDQYETENNVWWLK